ncbi:NAD(P)/FAD-dependent oxidoreductase [Flavobacterium pallidum]|uniref:FAD-dependent oxidoreductase n=1 Tax=Flavobacterium pallidum TaxID=2172098 RepID=A0A2S1SJB0_9FLAO|nr:NAD(P)/FAD-dependent oxidoreductase [Flavobacterium pallidum]AWI26471.1 FAD-dependent oxidoreductase [Flavobacterium pallidum]
MKKVLIIGGGLAGLTAAIHLSKSGIPVTLVEKNGYPKHKVCGEYISNEILPYFEWLGIDIDSLHPAGINTLQFTSVRGRMIGCKLPLGGFGISRYTLDDYLHQKAKGAGCKIITATVENVVFKDDIFQIVLDNGNEMTADIVIGAYGKRSSFDIKLQRKFIGQKSPWLAVKSHYKGNFPDDVVGLYNFEGGYCGISKVENGNLNVCYLADYDTFKKHKNILEYEKKVLYKNPSLKHIFENAAPVFEKPLSISQISFESKNCVENHILMTGDSAGLIHPMCGNGMAMAIHSAKMASEGILKFCHDPKYSRSDLESEYTAEWRKNFSKRLKTGKALAKVLQNRYLSGMLMQLAFWFPVVLPFIIRKTHGKVLTIKNPCP